MKNVNSQSSASIFNSDGWAKLNKVHLETAANQTPKKKKIESAFGTHAASGGLHDCNLSDIKMHLDEAVVGNDDSKKKILIFLMSKLRDLDPSPICFVGPSNVGKCKIVQEIAASVKTLLTVIDCAESEEERIKNLSVSNLSKTRRAK